MARALMITETERDEIAIVVALAKYHPISSEDLAMATQLRHGTPEMDQWKTRLNDFTLDLPVGYRVTYTLEYQPPSLCHHISVSVDTLNTYPDPSAVAMICREFGMMETAYLLEHKDDELARGPTAIASLYREQYENGRYAVNIVALIEPSPRTLTAPGPTVH